MEPKEHLRLKRVILIESECDRTDSRDLSPDCGRSER